MEGGEELNDSAKKSTNFTDLKVITWVDKVEPNKNISIIQLKRVLTYCLKGKIDILFFHFVILTLIRGRCPVILIREY